MDRASPFAQALVDYSASFTIITLPATNFVALIDLPATNMGIVSI